MAKRSSGCGWLIIAALFGFITLGVFGFGAYGIWHTTTNHALHEKAYEKNTRDFRELQPNKSGAAKAKELQETSKALQEQIADDQLHRNIAYGITAGSVCPGVFTLLFAMMFVILWLKSGGKKDVVQTSEENSGADAKSEGS